MKKTFSLLVGGGAAALSLATAAHAAGHPATQAKASPPGVVMITQSGAYSQSHPTTIPVKIGGTASFANTHQVSFVSGIAKTKSGSLKPRISTLRYGTNAVYKASRLPSGRIRVSVLFTTSKLQRFRSMHSHGYTLKFPCVKQLQDQGTLSISPGKKTDISFSNDHHRKVTFVFSAKIPTKG